MESLTATVVLLSFLALSASQKTNTSFPLTYRVCSCNSTGGWARVAYLNMTDPSQQCPSAWTLQTPTQFRTEEAMWKDQKWCQL